MKRTRQIKNAISCSAVLVESKSQECGSKLECDEAASGDSSHV